MCFVQWKIQNNNLFINGTLVLDIGKIESVIEKKNVLIVQTSLPPSAADRDANVFGFNALGEKLWQIQSFLRPNGGANPVAEIHEKDGKIILYFSYGVIAELNVKTGEYQFPATDARPW